MVRRSSSRFRLQEPTVPNVPAMDDEGNHNDAASDLGSDIMTVSDIHTITNENEIAMMQQQQHQKTLNKLNLDLLTPTPYGSSNADVAGGIGNYNVYSPSDIRTIDNDNASIISDLQHTVGTAGGGGGGGTVNDDIHTVTGTVTGSVLHLSSPMGGTNDNVGSTVVLGVSANNVDKPTIAQAETVSDNSFWSRAKRTLGIAPTVPNVASQGTADYDEYYDEGRPIPYLNTPGVMMKNTNDDLAMYPNAGNLSTPPPAVIVTTRTNDIGNNEYAQMQRVSGGDSFSNAMIAPTTSVWKQRLCGLRADRLVLLLVFVLLAAVGVIVGAIIVSQQDETNSSSTSNAENERPGMDDDGTMITLTRTPTTARPTVFIPTAAPISNITDPICDNNITLMDDLKVTFPVTDNVSNNGTIQYNDCEWVSSQSAEELSTLCQPDTAAYELCRLTCQNCNELPMNKKKAWPIELCGGDSLDKSFDAGMNQGMGNCYWLSKSPFDIDRLCQPDNDAYDLCRETCRNCGPNVTSPIKETKFPSISPTTSPSFPNVTSTVPSVVPSAAPISLSLAPSVKNESETTFSPTASPSSFPVAVTLAPITEAPITEAPVTEAPVTALDALAGIIISASPESSDRLSSVGSAQSQALEWLRSALDAGTFDSSISDARTVQIWTLATFAFSLGLSEVWLTGGGSDECLWDGIVCSSDTRTVIGIDLEARTISGTIPPEVSLLSGLVGLNLSTNNISGKLPSDFGSTFQQLEDLRFDRNELTGTLPSTIGEMSALRIWYMERNPDFTGTVPSTIVQLSNLEEFVLYYTGITGVIPQGICDLPNLVDLRLDCMQTSFDGDSCWTRCLFLCGGDSGVPCNT